MAGGGAAGSARGAAARTSGSGSFSAALDGGLRPRRGVRPKQRQRARPCDGGLPSVGDQLIEALLGVGGAGPASAERKPVVALRLAAARKPFGDHARRPLRPLVGVACGAGVGRSDRERQIRARHAQAVIAPVVDDHIGLGGHMAVDALRARAARLVMGVGGDVELGWQMALRAKRIAFGPQGEAMRLMAVRAGDAGMMHAALQERAIFEHLAVDLPVGMIEAGLQQRRQIGVEEGRSDRRILGDDLAARMASARRHRVRGHPPAPSAAAMPVSGFMRQTSFAGASSQVVRP